MSQQEFEHYLNLLARMLKLTPKQRDAIADELRTHLEERLDELQHEGHDREQAIALALDEFGDANALAHEFSQTAQRASQRRTRRRLMQTTAGTLIAAAAVTFAVMTLTPNNFQGTPTQTTANAEAQQNSGPEKFLPDLEPVKIDPATLRELDQVSLELRLMLLDAQDAAEIQGPVEALQLPGFEEAFALRDRDQLRPWWTSPSAHTLIAPRVTTFIGHRASFMTATQYHEPMYPAQMPGVDNFAIDKPALGTISRGLLVGSLILPAPDGETLRLSLDLQTVWSDTDPQTPFPSFGSVYGKVRPARPIGTGWSPGLTGLRFQFEADPKTPIALKLPVREAQLQLTDEGQGRDVWLIAEATIIKPDQAENQMFPELNKTPDAHGPVRTQ